MFVFQTPDTLITATSSVVALTGGATACNVFWQVGSSATLGVGSTMVGSIAALASISATSGAVVEGRLLARTGAVTLDSNTVTSPVCAPAATPSATVTATATATATASATATATASATASASSSSSPAATITSSPSSSAAAGPTGPGVSGGGAVGPTGATGPVGPGTTPGVTAAGSVAPRRDALAVTGFPVQGLLALGLVLLLGGGLVVALGHAKNNQPTG